MSDGDERVAGAARRYTNVVCCSVATARNVSGLPVHSLLECGMEQQGPDICDDRQENYVNRND